MNIAAAICYIGPIYFLRWHNAPGKKSSGGKKPMFFEKLNRPIHWGFAHEQWQRQPLTDNNQDAASEVRRALPEADVRFQS